MSKSYIGVLDKSGTKKPTYIGPTLYFYAPKSPGVFKDFETFEQGLYRENFYRCQQIHHVSIS